MTAWDPAAYARNSGAQLQWASELLSRLHLEANDLVLDLGCGDGKITAALARAVPQGRVVGIDSSKEMIGYARGHHSDPDHQNLDFRVLDVQTLDYTSEFTLAFSNAALHWVRDHGGLLRCVHRALRNGGRLAFSFGGKGNAADVLNVASAVGRKPEWRDYFQGFHNPYSFYGPDEYRPWLVNAGFTVTRLDLVPKDMVHHGRQGLDSWIRTTWMPLTGNVPEVRRADFIRDLGDAYVREFAPDPDGNIHVRMVRLEVEAIKPA